MTVERKRAREEYARGQALINAADATSDHLAQLPSFQRKTFGSDLEVVLECCTSSQLTESTFDWCVDLVTRNMKASYEQSTDGWNGSEKRIEMAEKDARYLIVRDASNGQPVAMSHFRFTFEDSKEVLYCYELQVEASIQGRGVGKFIMMVLALIGTRARMRKVMLTVFKHNTRAARFYSDKMGYEIDETSPSCFDAIVDYEIMSRTLKLPATTIIT